MALRIASLVWLASLTLFTAPLPAQQKSEQKEPTQKKDDKKPATWDGKMVVVKRSGLQTSIGREGKRVVAATLTHITYRVIVEKEGYVLLRHKGVEGWLPKANVVVVDKAVEYFTQQIKANPKVLSYFMYRAEAYRHLKKLDEAIDDYSEALRLSPKSSAIYNNRGNIWSSRKKYDKAIADYTEAIKLRPTSSVAYYNRGLAWRNKKLLDKAIADFARATEIEPGYPRPWYYRGVVRREQRDYRRAIEHFGKALELNPKYAAAYTSLALIALDRNKDGEALELLNKAIKADAKYASAFLNRGIFYQKKKQFAKAKEDFEQGVRADKEYHRGMNALAWLLATCPDKSLRDGKRAMSLVEKAMELDKNKSINYQSTLAAALARVGRFHEAQWWQERVVHHYSYRREANDTARRRLAHYRRGEAWTAE